MMFVFNEFWPSAALMFGAILIVSLVQLRKTRERFNGRTNRYERMPVSLRFRTKATLKWLLGCFVILNVLAWTSTWLISLETQVEETKFDSGVYPTESFGLKPGESYPMSLGQLGFSSNIDIRKAPFYFSYQERSGATSIISVTHDDETYILEIPVSVTKYYQVEGVEPSMRLFFNTGDIFSERDVMGQWQTTRTDTYEPCRSQFTNLLWTCIRGELISSVEATEELSQEQIEAGLTYWVQKYLKRAEITLTPEMHDELIGKIG